MTPKEMMEAGDKLYDQGSPGGAREWYAAAFANLEILTGNQIEALEKRNAELSAELEQRERELLRKLEALTLKVPRWIPLEQYRLEHFCWQQVRPPEKGHAYVIPWSPEIALEWFNSIPSSPPAGRQGGQS